MTLQIYPSGLDRASTAEWEGGEREEREQSRRVSVYWELMKTICQAQVITNTPNS